MNGTTNEKAHFPEALAKEIGAVVEMAQKNTPILKVILFGSFAYGYPNTDSDIDLCFITADSRSELELMQAYRKQLTDKIGRPLDILVYTPEKFAWRAESVSTIEKTILSRGITVYG